jgi:hypothetical protein
MDPDDYNYKEFTSTFIGQAEKLIYCQSISTNTSFSFAEIGIQRREHPGRRS